MVGMRPLAWLFAGTLLVSSLSSASAAYETVTGTVNRSDSVLYQDWDAYEVAFSGLAPISVQITADVVVDFYVFTATQYADYSNPSVPTFGYVDSQENAISFQYVLTASGLIVVIDNADVSASGASPSGLAPYSVSILYPTGGTTPSGDWGLAIAVVGVIVAVLAVAVSIALARRRKPEPPTAAAPRTGPVSAIPPVSPIPAPPPSMSGPTVGGSTPPTGASPQTPARCPRCGAAVYPNATFCTSCGMRLR